MKKKNADRITVVLYIIIMYGRLCYNHYFILFSSVNINFIYKPAIFYKFYGMRSLNRRQFIATVVESELFFLLFPKTNQSETSATRSTPCDDGRRTTTRIFIK